jgi:hypothetical protein
MVEWVEGAGIQSEKSGFPLELIPHNGGAGITNTAFSSGTN